MSEPKERLSGKTWLMIGGLILLFPVLAVIALFVSKGNKQTPPGLIQGYRVEGVAFAPANKPSDASSDVKKAVFADSDWSPVVLQIYEAGPVLMSRGLEFEVAPPPDDASAETAAELETLRNFAANLRTNEMKRTIFFEEEMRNPMISYEEAGLFLSLRNPEAETLIKTALRDVGYFILKYKDHYKRIRPDHIDTTLKTVIPNPGHPAYPSGHGGQSHMVGLLLGLLDEKHKDIYMAHAWAIGTRREIAGVHYPSDAVAGRKLAEDVLEKLLEVPAFQEQLKKAKDSFTTPEESAFENYKKLEIDPALIAKPKEEPAKQ